MFEKVKRTFHAAVALLRAAALRLWAHKLILAVVVGVLVLVVVGQFLYPSGTVLPFSKLNGERVSTKSETAIREQIRREYAAVPLTLKMSDKQHTGDTAQAGLLADDAKTVEALTTYRWWQRLVPFSLPFVGLMRNQPVVAKLEAARFADYARTRAMECAVTPKDAGVAVHGDKVALEKSENGRACSAASIREALTKTPMQKKGMVVVVKPQVVTPERTDKEVTAQLTQAQTIADRTLTVDLKGTQKIVPKATIASWLIFPQDAKTHDLSVAVDEAKVKEYLASVQSAVYVQPGTTRISTLDGAQTGIVPGVSGTGINMDTTAKQVQQQLLKGNGTVAATLTSLPPRVVYDRSYTATQAGLQALLNDIVADKGNYAIAVRTANGAVVASANGSKQYHPASTYKMFVGWAIIKQVAAGQLHWEDAATAGKNISQCFDVMIINSDNTCGEWLGQKIGWANLNNQLKDIGLSCTNLATAWYSCANDETLFLHKLQGGQLLPADQADRLLSVMKKQVYRSGIPAGVGVTVADKVGFLDGKLHDAGIVYAPHGTYSLTILTSGSSWGQIADAARQINAQLARM